MELHGVTGAPYKTPQVRKHMPPPFTRTRVDLDAGTRVKRSWKDTPVEDVAAGDTVAGFGTVAAVHTDEVIEDEWVCSDDGSGEDILVPLPFTKIRIHNVAGACRVYPIEQRVYAFSADAA